MPYLSRSSSFIQLLLLRGLGKGVDEEKVKDDRVLRRPGHEEGDNEASLYIYSKRRGGEEEEIVAAVGGGKREKRR